MTSENLVNVYLLDRPELVDFMETGLVELFIAIFGEKVGIIPPYHDIADVLDSKARLEVLRLLANHERPDVTVREIEALTGFPPKVAEYLAGLLCRLGILQRRSYGSIQCYRLKTEDAQVKSLSQFMMQVLKPPKF